MLRRKGNQVYQDLAQRFSTLLQLKQPPVGLAFVDTVPDSVPALNRRVPSACTFWRLAEEGVFYAGASDHQECPIGMLTMGFSLSIDYLEEGREHEGGADREERRGRRPWGLSSLIKYTHPPQ